MPANVLPITFGAILERGAIMNPLTTNSDRTPIYAAYSSILIFPSLLSYSLFSTNEFSLV
jgi:hypothetical protein